MLPLEMKVEQVAEDRLLSIKRLAILWWLPEVAVADA
jgi:hypothetical protein